MKDISISLLERSSKYVSVPRHATCGTLLNGVNIDRNRGFAIVIGKEENLRACI